MAISSVVSLFHVVQTFFISFGLLGLLAAISFLFCHHYQVCNLADGLFCHVDCFRGGDNLLNFFRVLVVGVQEGHSDNF